MRGSIRTLVGFLVTYGAVGGIDNSSDAGLLALVAIAAVGLLIMISGIKAMREVA